MAQSQSSSSSSSEQSGAKPTTARGQAGEPASGARRLSLRGLMRRSVVDRPTASGTGETQPKRRGQTFQFILGLFIFMLGSQLLLSLILWIGDALRAREFLLTTVAPRDVFVLGGLPWYMFFWLVLVALFYWVLVRTNVIPRDPWGVKARAQQQTTTRAGAGKKTTPTPTINLRPQTRADRRAAAAARAAKAPPAKGNASASTKNKGGKSEGKAPQSETDTSSGEFDEEYQRVKALQRRQMRRRVAKR